MPLVIFVGGIVETLNIEGCFGAKKLLHPSVLVRTHCPAAVSIGALEYHLHAQGIGDPVIRVAQYLHGRAWAAGESSNNLRTSLHILQIITLGWFRSRITSACTRIKCGTSCRPSAIPLTWPSLSCPLRWFSSHTIMPCVSVACSSACHVA
jgi:hypothetical protein